MLHNALRGAAAGAVGTVALDILTYADMAARGRAPSEVPAKLVQALADKVGIAFETGDDAARDRAEQRKSALGALLGYLTGLGVGAAYGVVAPRLRGRSTLARGIGVGLAAMAASDVPIAASGASDLRTWGWTGWLADAIPHLAYSLATVAVIDAFTRRSGGNAASPAHAG